MHGPRWLSAKAPARCRLRSHIVPWLSETQLEGMRKLAALDNPLGLCCNRTVISPPLEG